MRSGAGRASVIQEDLGGLFMVTNDATILKIKHEVLYRVAKLAYEGKFEEEREKIPYEMIPGPKA